MADNERLRTRDRFVIGTVKVIMFPIFLLRDIYNRIPSKPN
jgi:hypothetical protein